MSTFNSISVLIPNYNRAKLIPQVIESIRGQTRPPDEIIVVDDTSTDDSVAVLKTCPVKLICHSTNAGPAVARNHAFAASQGDLIIFIDADAIADPAMIENLCKVYEDAADADRLGGVGGRGVEKFTEGLANRWRCTHSRQDHGENFRPDVEYLFGLCCSYTRTAFERIHGFDSFYRINAGEDLDIGLRARRAGYRLAYTPDAVVYHQHNDTLDNLKRVQYNWSYWNYVTRKRNQQPVGKAYLGLVKRVIVDTVYDLIARHDPEMAMVNLGLFRVKAKAISAAKAASNP